MTEKMQADVPPSRQAGFVRCCLNSLERKILHEYGTDTLCVGYGNEGDHQIFLTAEGQLLIRDIKVGRTIWEGIQCIMGY